MPTADQIAEVTEHYIYLIEEGLDKLYGLNEVDLVAWLSLITDFHLKKRLLNTAIRAGYTVTLPACHN
jgi:hypothetical protein